MRDESGFRRPKYRQGTLAVLLLVGLSGCASQSGQTFATLDRNHPQFHSEQCQAAIRDTEIHDDIKILRAIASPVAVVLSGGLLLPAVFASNVGLDTVDRVDASRLDISCGGVGQSAGQIVEGVVKGAAFGLATSAAGAAVGAGALPTSTASSK
jgi:hypothetical protein